jgi:hypothetical protein
MNVHDPPDPDHLPHGGDSAIKTPCSSIVLLQKTAFPDHVRHPGMDYDFIAHLQ